MKTKSIIVFVIFVHTTLSLNPEVVKSLEEQPLPRTQRDSDKVNYEIELDDGKMTYESNLIDQSYSYRLETSDGTIKHETGHFEEEDNLVVEGGYEYIGDNGIKYSVTYVADKNGYRPKVSFGFGTKVAPGASGPTSTFGTPPTPAREPLEQPTTTIKSIDSDEVEPLLGGGVAKRSS